MQAALKPRLDFWKERDPSEQLRSVVREPMRYTRPEMPGLESSLSGPERLSIIFFLGSSSWALVLTAAMLIKWLA